MSINKGPIKGRVTEAKGMIREAAGKLVGNDRLDTKGKFPRVLGKAQPTLGDLESGIQDATK